LGTESEVAPEALRSRLTLAFRARTRPHLPRSRTSVDFTDPQVNLLNADLLGLPPIAVFYGEDELLVSEAVEFGLRAQRAGNDVIVRSVEAGQHSFIMGAGRVPEVDQAITEMGGWLRSKLARRPANI
jgi:epsilon-lactone hydrolase